MNVLRCLLLVGLLAGCGAQQNAIALLSSYNSAMAAEDSYLYSGKATPAGASTLRALRLTAHDAVQAAVKSDPAASSPLYAVAAVAVANLAAASVAAFQGP